ncbi:N-acetylmuramoyl-L-alanine amidase [Caballeronia pedi]|uniref:N-acetylmuramoyl-L-alanine amidase n=1 Tax=Caballeronia pedi TaxID=1777141 RepID=A0A158ALB1_9BURK|nr:peptidoglycan recognition family protein [Caballeronia pedi]SAK58594.1 N-acetylmuramoyl-L-alanine amidase [Caballeronia pedi]
MLFISKQGHVDHDRVRIRIFNAIEHGSMNVVHGIVVHQTGASTAESTFSSYQQKGANGAHFLLDQDGTIYQTASLTRVTYHVGNIKSRCLETLQCSPVEIAASREAFRQGKYKGLNRHEMTKSWPDRLPSNIDSIGIELVGMYRGEGKEQIYEDPTSEQNDSLKWLIAELIETLSIDKAEVYAHPAVSYKNPTEAKAAQW